MTDLLDTPVEVADLVETVVVDQKAIHEAEKVMRGLLVTDETALSGYVTRRAQVAARARAIGDLKPYSLHNQFSLEAQCRRRGLVHLGVYAGPKQWAEHGRIVKDGAPTLAAWVPVLRTEEDPADPTRQRSRYCGSFTVAVIDYTDTIAEDPDFVEPDFESPLFGGDRTVLDALAGGSSVPVTFAARASAAERSSFDGARVLVDSSAPLANQIGALAHQRVHQILGDARHPASRENELTATLGQWLFMEMVGLGASAGNDVTSAALEGLQHWDEITGNASSGGHKARLRLVHEKLRPALRVAGELLASL